MNAQINGSVAARASIKRTLRRLPLLACVLLACAGCAGVPAVPGPANRDAGARASARPTDVPFNARIAREGAEKNDPSPLAHREHLKPDEAAPPEDPDGDLEAGNDGETEAQMWELIEEIFARKGELKEGVYRLVTPRSDLFVTMDGMDVPAGAFLESDFRFWRCPCGKILVNGQFVLADYEVNDVVDELQKGRLDVVTIAPLLLHEHPRLLMVRFQGEGRTRAFAEALKSALSYTGDARNAAQPMDLSPDPD